MYTCDEGYLKLIEIYYSIGCDVLILDGSQSCNVVHACIIIPFFV